MNQTSGVAADKRSRMRLKKCRFDAIKPCGLIFRRVSLGKNPSGDNYYGNEHVDFDGLVLQSLRLTETLKLARSVPDVLFLQIALDDGTINPVSSKIRRMFC